MTTHELARRLLELPDLPVCVQSQMDSEVWICLVDTIEQRELVMSLGVLYPADYFRPPLKDAELLKAVVLE